MATAREIEKKTLHDNKCEAKSLSDHMKKIVIHEKNYPVKKKGRK